MFFRSLDSVSRHQNERPTGGARLSTQSSVQSDEVFLPGKSSHNNGHGGRLHHGLPPRPPRRRSYLTNESSTDGLLMRGSYSKDIRRHPNQTTSIMQHKNDTGGQNMNEGNTIHSESDSTDFGLPDQSNLRPRHSRKGLREPDARQTTAILDMPNRYRTTNPGMVSPTRYATTAIVLDQSSRYQLQSATRDKIGPNRMMKSENLQTNPGQDHYLEGGDKRHDYLLGVTNGNAYPESKFYPDNEEETTDNRGYYSDPEHPGTEPAYPSLLQMSKQPPRPKSALGKKKRRSHKKLYRELVAGPLPRNGHPASAARLGQNPEKYALDWNNYGQVQPESRDPAYRQYPTDPAVSHYNPDNTKYFLSQYAPEYQTEAQNDPSSVYRTRRSQSLPRMHPSPASLPIQDASSPSRNHPSRATTSGTPYGYSYHDTSSYGAASAPQPYQTNVNVYPSTCPLCGSYNYHTHAEHIRNATNGNLTAGSVPVAYQAPVPPASQVDTRTMTFPQQQDGIGILPTSVTQGGPWTQHSPDRWTEPVAMAAAEHQQMNSMVTGTTPESR